MKHRSFHFLVILLITLVVRESFAIPNFFRILAQADRPHTDQISPSPSPAAAFNPNNSGKQGSGNKLSNGDAVAENACDKVSRKCTVPQINVTACFPHAEKGPESHLIVIYNGTNPQQLNITFLPKNKTLENVELKPKLNEMNISSDIGGSSSIVVSAGNLNCTISLGASFPTTNYNFPSYTPHVTPIYGAFFLAMVGLIVGGTLLCCKFWKRERHLGEVPYQELQLGEQGSLSSTKVESAAGWDEDWDDDWDEEKAVKSPGPKRLANGNTTASPDTNHWGNDWDD
nr:uncharacterized protein LOC109193962 [Ipomoea batatas]